MVPGGFGGGLYATGYVEVSNTTFESNSSGYHGGAIRFTYRAPLHRHHCCPESG